MKKSLFFISFLVFTSAPFGLFAQSSSENPYSLGPGLDEETESTPPEQPIEESPNLFFDQREWNKMRRDMEGGVEPGVPIQQVETSTKAVEPPKPPPGLLNVELPYESSLSITGRKVIKLDIQNTHISRERANELGTKQDTQSFNMEQELQARIQGTVARKTTINVNFDDTKENVKDFSVVYKGDPDEVVQEAAFGDIVLSLPSTEFVNYNKQLFGIRTALKYKKFGLMAIGSRTKGTTETKRFTGSTTRQQIFVNDTAYIRRKFYDLTFSTASAMQTGPLNGRVVLPISGTVPEDVFVEDTTGLNPQAVNMTVALATEPATTVTIRMRQMSPGVDYSIDRIDGIITFVNPLSEDVRVAVDFTLASGERLQSLVAPARAVLIKDRTPEAPQASQEIKRFYSAGARNIIRDNGLGNFIFKVLDKNRETEIGNTLSPIQKYPDSIEMRFETGIFELFNRLPFEDLYVSNVNTASPLHAVFSVEYQAIQRTYTLRPNIVLQSETVEVNGRKLSRDLDYFIDYDIGIITFFNEDLIRESTVIEVTYEFAPFGGQLGETLVGARGTYDILQNKKMGPVSMENWGVGSTVLYNFAAKPTGPPDVRSTPSSLLVTEGDTSVKGLQFGSFPLKSNFQAETAKSTLDPNLFGKALIDSMEGIKQEDASSLLEESWQPSSNPRDNSFNVVTDFRGRENPASHLRWRDTDVLTSDANDGNANQKALEIDFSLNTNSSGVQEQMSLINVISQAGRDFSKKTTLEVEIENEVNDPNVQMIISYGSFNEDADADGLDTEDEIPFDGVLNLGEDVGFTFNGPGDDLVSGNADDTIVQFGAVNTRLDSEDLNGNRQLTPEDLPATFTPLFTQPLNFTTRQLFQIPIDASKLTPEEQGRLTAVKHVRVTLRNLTTTSRTGRVRIVRVSVVGNTYEPATITPTGVSTMTVKAVNNKDDVGIYTPLTGNADYNDLYKSATPKSDQKEQALSLDYELVAGASATTRNAFSAPRDFSKHKIFKFFLSKPPTACVSGCGGKVFLQVGSETEYQQATVDLSAVPSNPQWLTVSIKQLDLNTDGTPDTWESITPGVVISRVGNAPNLTQVSQIKIGVLNDTGAIIKNQVWINEIHQAEPNSREGHAQKYSFDSNVPQWVDFGGMYRDVDRNWQTPTTAITNQDSTQQNAYMNFNRISFMPMSFKTTRDRTITPSAFRANNNALVSFLEEGRVERVNNLYTTKLIIPKLPVLDMNYNNDTTENTITRRTEITDTVNLGATYSPTVNWDLLPGNRMTFKFVPNSITYFHTSRRTKLRFPGLDKLLESNISTAPFTSTNLTQYSEEDEARLAFRPWDGFSFNPTYKLRVEKEERDFRNDEIQSLGFTPNVHKRKTPRSMTQSVSASGNLRLLKWLDPRYNYSFNGTETNGLPTQSNTTAYQTKTITRNSQGEVSGSLLANQILPRSRLLNSMNMNLSYKLENGDTYNDMPEGFSWRGKLWVAHPLDVSSGTLARRVDATDRRTFRNNLSWQPLSSYQIQNPKLRPFGTLSLTSNYQRSIERSETTGTTKKVDSRTWPDLVMTMSDAEDIFGVERVIDNSRLVIKTNTRKTETQAVSLSKTETWGTDYQFQFVKKYDVSTSFNISTSRDDNLVTRQLTNKTDIIGYAIQTRIPWKAWAFTPRFERNETESRDAIQLTNDLRNDIISLQIYGDISKPLGIRFGRKEIGLANRFILNSTIKWDKKRSEVNPATNYLDTYSATVSGDYTISQNFRMALGGNFSQEVHHPDFKKLDQLIFGLNATLTIQF